MRTGSTHDYGGGQLDAPAGETRTLTQRYEVVDELGVAPAAWKPVSMSGAPVSATRVSDEGGFAVQGSLASGTNYTVESRVPLADPSTLRSAGTDYPEAVSDRYTTIPSSTPDRLTERTDRITANADNPYDTARMDAGYCTYFATTMVTMLRSQDVPARFVVGYTEGQRVDRDEYVVRGYDAHAWVEVYFPDVGWVRFDPTPAGPRRAAEGESLEEAREQNRTDVDTNDSTGGEWTPTETATPAPLTPPDEQAGGGSVRTITPPDNPVPEGLNRTAANGSGPEATTLGDVSVPGEGGDSDGGIDWPSREEATLVGIALFGIVVGVRRLGLLGRVYRAIWLR
ncbi:transglutaminase, partial [Halobacteriales archaeon QH_7_68_42]